jgi:hypothetical protein
MFLRRTARDYSGPPFCPEYFSPNEQEMLAAPDKLKSVVSPLSYSVSCIRQKNMPEL